MKYFFLFAFILSSTHAFTQVEFLKKKGSKYYYESKIYEYDELDSIYSYHLPAMDLYLQGRKLKSLSSRNFSVGIGLIAFGAFLIGTGAEGPLGRSSANGYASFSVYSIIGGGIFSGFGFYQSYRSWNKFDDARNAFNFYLIEQNGYKSSMSLHLTTSSNGIGVALRF